MEAIKFLETLERDLDVADPLVRARQVQLALLGRLIRAEQERDAARVMAAALQTPKAPPGTFELMVDLLGSGIIAEVHYDYSPACGDGWHEEITPSSVESTGIYIGGQEVSDLLFSVVFAALRSANCAEQQYRVEAEVSRAICRDVLIKHEELAEKARLEGE